MSDPHSPRPLVAYPDAVRTALGLMRSAVLSGESWSVELAAAYEGAVAALPAAEPAATADAAWEALEDESAVVMRRSGDLTLRQAIARHRPLIEAAIRSAGTSPASREALLRLIEHHAAAECYRYPECENATSAARAALDATPPEPVGGREAQEAITDYLRSVIDGHLEPHGAEDPVYLSGKTYAFRLVKAMLDEALVAVSPPTGVSDGVALDVDRLHQAYLNSDLEFMRTDETTHKFVSRIAAEYERLAREQADSEPQHPEPPAAAG